MLKHLFLTLAILISVTGFISCSKDEPNNGGKDPIENPVDDPKDDPADDPTDDPKDDPADDGTVIVNADGTTSNGMPFRRINETQFMLNYVAYRLNLGHLQVNGYDKVEVSASLNGKVTIVPAIVIDGTKYFTREIGCFYDSNIKEIILPNTITEISPAAFTRAKSLKSIVIPENVKVIGYKAFCGCTALEEVKLNENLETIEYDAFAGCVNLVNLRSIDLPENICLEPGCFNEVPLEDITLPIHFRINSYDTHSKYGAIFSSSAIKNIYMNGLPIDDDCIGYLFSDDIKRQATLYVPEYALYDYKKHKYWGKFKQIKGYNPE